MSAPALPAHPFTLADLRAGLLDPAAPVQPADVPGDRGPALAPAAARDSAPATATAPDGTLRTACTVHVTEKVPPEARTTIRTILPDRAALVERDYLNVVGAADEPGDGLIDADDHIGEVGRPATYRVLLTDDEQAALAAEPTVAAVEPDPTGHAHGAATRGVSYGRGSTTGGNSASAQCVLYGFDGGSGRGDVDRVKAGDLVIWGEAIAATSTSGIGAPSGSGWIAVRAPVVNASGVVLTIYYRIVTAGEQATNNIITTLGLGATREWCPAPVIVPRGAFDPANPIAAVTAVATSGVNPAHPAATTPNLGGKAMLALGMIATRNPTNSGFGYGDWNSRTTAPWNASYGISTNSIVTMLFEGAYVAADGAVCPATTVYSSDTYSRAYAAVTILITPKAYPVPTSTIDAPTSFIDGQWNLSGYRIIFAADDHLELGPGGSSQVTRKDVLDVTGRATIVRATDIDVTGTDRCGFSIGSGSDNRIFCYVAIESGVQALRLGVYRLGTYYPAGGGIAWDSTYNGLWIRLREDSGLALLDVSSNPAIPSGWLTVAQMAHGLSDEQLGAGSIGFDTYGSVAARWDSLNPVGLPASTPTTTPVPSDRTLRSLRATRDPIWSGTGVTIAVLDSGTTGPVRSWIGPASTTRTTFVGNPPAGYELFPPLSHGCFVASCAVPRGAALLDYLITSDGSASFATMAAAMRYAVQQGAALIVLSYGDAAGASGGSTAVTDVLAATRAGSLGPRGADVQFFMSAGNDGASVLSYPARYGKAGVYDDLVTPVGAIDETAPDASAVTAFTNKDPDVVLAPGLSVAGLTPLGRFQTGSGTSYAGPLVARMVADEMTGGAMGAKAATAVVKAALRSLGLPAATQGKGAVDLQAALRRARRLQSRSLIGL